MIFRNYSFGCHGIQERCFTIKGMHMPFCARCLGTSIGHIAAIINFFLFQMFSMTFVVIGLTIMFTDWFFQNKLKFYHSNILRLITGVLGGFSVGILIWKTIDWLIHMF